MTPTAFVHQHVLTTIFWVGEPAGPENDHIHNASSAWDEDWLAHFGGVDDPLHRDGWWPAGFRPNENPFYCALPYDDLTPDGARKPTALRVVPWAHERDWADGESMLKDRWLRIDHPSTGRTCYAQWEDSGPCEYDDAAYVFGTAAPINRTLLGAGLDVSPAVRDYLGLGDSGYVDWCFVDAREVPEGAWREIVTGA
jgi:hypothetical protein